jgi:RimJ/RimL family protein N-acetyltransferase
MARAVEPPSDPRRPRAVARESTTGVGPFPPEVETDRLLLRRWETGDADWFAAVNAQREVVRFVNEGVPFTPAESRVVSARISEHWEQFGFGLWAVRDRATGAALGFAGVCHPLWLPDWAGEVEVGWRLRREAWGHGFATEAGHLALAAGFEALGLERIVAFVHPENRASVAVTQRLGMGPAGRIAHPFRDHELDVFEARRPAGG